MLQIKQNSQLIIQMLKKRPRSQIYEVYELQKKNSFQSQLFEQSVPNLKQLNEMEQKRVLIILRDNLENYKNQRYFFGRRPKIYVNPMSRIAAIWAFVIIMTSYFMMFQISITLGFGPHLWQQEIQNTKYLLMYLIWIFLLVLDMAVIFNKGFYAFGRGKIIDDWQKIISNYLKYYFWIDLITILCLIIPLIHSEFYLNFLQFLPMVFLYIKKFRCQEEITSSLKYNRTLRNFFTLFMLACDILLIGSFGASIFVGLDLLLWHLQYYGSNSAYYWLSNNSSLSSIDFFDEPWYIQYVFAQSFSTGTLSTLAPGPFAKNPIQIFYAIILMTFFMLLASYAGQVLIQVLYSYEQIRIFHEKNIQKFDQFMLLKGVENKIRQKVHNFFELIWEVQVKMNVQLQKQTISKFPLSIQQELYYEMGFCRYARIFSNFSKRTLLQKQISMKINSEVIDGGSFIFRAGALIPPTSRFLYYIKSGLCKFQQPNQDTQKIIALSNLEKTVGQYQFITGISYSSHCKSIDLCVIQKISYSDFIGILQANQLMEEFFYLKYQLLIEQKFNLISKMCTICEGEHIEKKCTCINISNHIKLMLFETGGILNTKRKKASRKKVKSTKIFKKCGEIQKLEPKASSIFSQFKILGEIILNISKTEKSIEQFQNFTHYYPQFNL